MRDDERLFSIGLQFFIITLVAVAVFHVMFNSTERALSQKNKTMRMLDQDLANASVRFSELVQPEMLRPVVMRVHPYYRPIGSGRTIGARDIE